MTTGLNIDRLVRVSVNLSPLAVGRRGFGTLLIAGDTDVIDVGERVRTYNSIDEVLADFDSTDPEAIAATLAFGQSPKVREVMIGRWARTATAGLLKCGVLSAAEATLSVWTAITDGSFRLKVDAGSLANVTGLNFSAATTMNGVATIIGAAITGASCTWDGSRFRIVSDTTGATSAITYLTTATASVGTDISALLKGTAATATAVVDGIAAETALAGVQALANASGTWYGLVFACATFPDQTACESIAAYIEAATPSRIVGFTITDTGVLDAEDDTDLASVLSAADYRRSCCVYSANPYAVASLFARAFSVNFSGSKTVLTLMYKVLPGVTSETLTATQADTLKAKRCNVYAAFSNDTAIVLYGVMSGDAYIDEQHGLDWLANAVQTALWNLLYTSKRKVPQTEAGQHQLVNEVTHVLAEAVENGLVAPGTWNADGFGQLERGDYLSEGFYVYSAPIDSQDQATREQRIAPPIQIAVKLAGAVHEVDAEIDVNR